MDDEYFNFKNVTLVSKNGKFYGEYRHNKNKVYELSHDAFKSMLVLSAQRYLNDKNICKVNKFDFLFDQLEITEDIFEALLYDKKKWINQ